jgi:hypothetical protein
MNLAKAQNPRRVGMFFMPTRELVDEATYGWDLPKHRPGE